jgi:hypothetical protein
VKTLYKTILPVLITSALGACAGNTEKFGDGKVLQILGASQELIAELDLSSYKAGNCSNYAARQALGTLGAEGRYRCVRQSTATSLPYELKVRTGAEVVAFRMPTQEKCISYRNAIAKNRIWQVVENGCKD